MKNFMKKLAFVMALAMVVTSIPAFTAKAATSPSLKVKSAVVYIGEKESCWTPVQNKGEYETSYSTTSNKITVNEKNGKITINKNATPGAAVVTVTYSLNGKTAGSENYTLKLRRSAETARLTNKTAAALTDAPLAVGAEVKVDVAKSYDGSYKKGHYGLNNYKSVVTDTVSLESSNPEVVAVDGLTVKALKPGKATISIVLTKAWSKALNTEATTKSYDVVVESTGMLSVTQKDATTLEVVLGAADASVSAASFNIIKKSTNQVYAVKSAVADSKDATKITLTTFMTMTDGADYEITYNNEDTLTFTATAGKVADIVIYPTTVEAEASTKVYANLVDANGVVINTVDAVNSVANVDFVVETTEGYTIDNELVLFEQGNKATVTVTVHSGNYDDYGNEVGNITKTATVVAVAKSAVINGDLSYTIANKDVDFDSFSQNLTLAVTDYDFNVYAYLTNSAKADVTVDEGYTFESADKDILVVGETTANTGKGIKANIVAVGGAGTTTYILVKNGNGTVVASIPVSIKANRTLTNFTLDKTTATVTNSELIEDTAVFTVSPVDQYGVATGDVITEAKLLTANADATVPTALDIDGTKATFNASGVKAGTYSYKVTVGNKLSKVVTVVVKDPSETATPVYKLVISDASVDAAFVSAAKTGTKVVSVKVGDYRNGILYQYVDTATDINDFTCVISLGGVAKNDANATDFTVRNVTETAVSKAAAGVYTVTATFNTTVDDKVKEYKLTGSFTVTDSQPVMTVVRNNVEAVAGSAEAIVTECFDFYYNGEKVTDAVTVESVTLYTEDNEPVIDTTKGTTTYAIKSVGVLYTIDGRAVSFTVSVGKTVTAK